ncbi:DUF3551 domain-containing protein [Bradyrhizobium sp. AS23.2]|uniref:DUF3551 domain-containing protein n=1 Tax=Bradyrhizobium sp. AS23.2 TaxID=1680155 RepID=UPI00093EF9DB|nr:DUF3551 domain-containing protein [Bradyrhizobium sp. AS23.2]OKO71549.1 hypothetical protein AC630_32640 [Bradyrhizobium sp. AS23.2]
MTTTVLKAMTIPAATLVAVIALGGLFASAAVRAAEYCSEDGYSFARNCSFNSMERCEAAISGTYAACLRDPFLKDDSIERINHNSDTYLLGRPIARPSQAAQPAAKADK